MSFADWISPQPVPATSATPATPGPKKAPRVATLASVAGVSRVKKTHEVVVAGDIETSDHWLIMRPPEKLERWFRPPISRTELAALYPGAALVPIQAVASSLSTDQQKAELTILLGLMAAASGFTQAEHDEALDNALRDPESALVGFSALARELGVAAERNTYNESMRLWMTIESEDGAQRVAVDIPKGKFDGVALLEMFEKHKKAGTTRVINIDTERKP